MPFDPNLPPNNVQVKAAELRGQFNGLKELIDAIAPGTITAVFIDSITTVEPNDLPSASVTLIGTELHFTFSIPRGQNGTNGIDGTNGTNGTNGIDGAQGPPGEVTQAALDAAIAGTSANSNAIGTLDTPFADPDAEALRTAFNGLVLALRRP